ncbi:MAG: VWA domain-containing protein [Pirellulales bacterium]
MDYGLSFDSPNYLWLLVPLLPAVWFLGRRSLSGLGRLRGALALLLRSAVAVLVVLALAELQWVRSHQRLTVFYLVDRSLSMPDEATKPIAEYINASVATHLQTARGDRAGVIAFGSDAAVEYPPLEGKSPPLQRFEAPVEGEHTDLAKALRLAQAAFPADGAKRVVIISDGNENLGSAREEALQAAEAGIGIDVLPVQTTARSDVSVERLVVPTDIREGAPFDLRIVLNNSVGDGGRTAPPTGRLRVLRRAGGETTLLSEEQVTLAGGRQVFTVREQLDEPDFYTYEAQFVPEEPGQDRFAQNNRATTPAHVRGRGRVLLIEDWSAPGEAAPLVARLERENLAVDVAPSNAAINTLGELQRYDCVVLSNVPRTSGDAVEDITEITDRQIQMLVRNTHELGCGLIMLGGPNSMGAGGWANTELEKAMPVDFQIKSLKVIPSGALAIVIDRSGSMMGDKLELGKRAAIEAIKVLGPNDHAGVVAFDSEAEWVAPMQVIRRPERMAAQIANLGPGGGTHLWPGMLEGFHALRKVPAAAKHMIILSDGHTAPGDYERLANDMQKMKMTVSCVALGQDADNALLDSIARAGGGRFYHVNQPSSVPKIFMKEARRVARPLIFEDPNGFAPRVTTFHEIVSGVGEPLPPITGYVMTTVKDNPLVEVPVVSPKPSGPNTALLATWTYGLGRSAVWTTDVGARWAKSWPAWPNYDKLFSQLVRWSLRPDADSGQFTMAANVQADQVELVVTALDNEDAFLNFLGMVGSVVRPDLSSSELALVQTAPGRYVGQFGNATPGTYLVSIVPGAGQAPLRMGITVPYSVEYTNRESNDLLLAELAALRPAGGEAGAVIDADGQLDDLPNLLKTDEFRGGLPRATSRRGVWHLCLFAAALLFFGDVFNRRVAVRLQPAIVWQRVKSRLARQQQERELASLGRLQQAKAAVATDLETRQATTRFEAAKTSDEPPPVAAGTEPVVAAAARDSTQAHAAAAAQATVDADAKQAAAAEPSYTSRLLKAKREVWKNRP